MRVAALAGVQHPPPSGRCRQRRFEGFTRGRAQGRNFDAPGPLMSGNGDADMVRANALACGSNFLLCLAVCQSKDLVTETWLVSIAASWFHRCRTPVWLCWSRHFPRGRRPAGRRCARLRSLAVAREHSLGRFELTKLT